MDLPHPVEDLIAGASGHAEHSVRLPPIYTLTACGLGDHRAPHQPELICDGSLLSISFGGWGAPASLHHHIPNELASVRSPSVNSGTIDRKYKGERYENVSRRLRCWLPAHWHWLPQVRLPRSHATTKANAGTSRAKSNSTSLNMACTFTLIIGSGVRRSISSGASTRVADTGREAFGSFSDV